MEKIFTIVIITVLTLNLVLTVATPLSALIINFVCRSDLDGWAYQEIKEGALGWYSWDDRGPKILFFDIMIPIIVVMVLEALTKECPALVTGLMYITLFLLTLPLLRWLVDVSRSLSIKKDTGDSEKLQEMRNEIEELKKAVVVLTTTNQKG